MDKMDFRNEQLLSELKKRGKMNINEIISMFDVSLSTARRMCMDLVESGKAIKIYKGIQIITPQNMTHLYSYNPDNEENVQEKRSIGSYASTLVSSGDVIYLSSGTTLQYFSAELAERIAKKDVENVLCVTNSIMHAEILTQYTKVILLGGEYRADRRDVGGFFTERIIKNTQFTKCFIGADGISLKTGLMASDLDTARMDSMVAERSEIIYILADRQKFSQKAFFSYGKLTEKHILIVDSDIDPNLVDEAKDLNIKLCLCPVAPDRKNR